MNLFFILTQKKLSHKDFNQFKLDNSLNLCNFIRRIFHTLQLQIEFPPFHHHHYLIYHKDIHLFLEPYFAVIM